MDIEAAAVYRLLKCTPRHILHAPLRLHPVCSLMLPVARIRITDARTMASGGMVVEEQSASVRREKYDMPGTCEGHPFFRLKNYKRTLL